VRDHGLADVVFGVRAGEEGVDSESFAPLEVFGEGGFGFVAVVFLHLEEAGGEAVWVGLAAVVGGRGGEV